MPLPHILGSFRQVHSAVQRVVGSPRRERSQNQLLEPLSIANTHLSRIETLLGTIAKLQAEQLRVLQRSVPNTSGTPYADMDIDSILAPSNRILNQTQKLPEVQGQLFGESGRPQARPEQPATLKPSDYTQLNSKGQPIAKEVPVKATEISSAGRPVAAPVASGMAEGAAGAGEAAAGAEAATGALAGLRAGLAALGPVAVAAGAAIVAGKVIFETAAKSVAIAIGAVTSAMNAAQLPITSTIDALKGFRDSVTAVGRGVSEFVRLANPAYVQQFELAADDLTASIGRGLIPVLQAATKFTRGFADIAFRLSPVMERLTRSFDPIVNAIPKFVNQLEPSIRAIEKFIGSLAELNESQSETLIDAVSFSLNVMNAQLVIAVTGMELMTNTLKALADISNGIMKDLTGSTSLFGAFKGGGREGDISNKSVGATARPATIGSIEDYGKKAQQAAYSLGSASTPAEKTEKNTENIYKLLVSWFSSAEQFPDRMTKAFLDSDIGKAFLKLASMKTSDVVKEISPEAGQVIDRARDAGRFIDRQRDNASGFLRDTFGIDV